VRSIFGGDPGGESYALVTSCSDVVDFLKPSETDLVIGFILIAIRVESEYIFVARSLSRWGSKGEPDAPIAAESEVTNFFRLLKLIRRSNSSMIAIGIEPEYRSVGRSLSGRGPKGESSAPIAAGSEVTDFFEADLTIGLIRDTYQGRARV
jgi:hypothetical protein